MEKDFRLGRLVLEQEALTYGTLITATAKDTRELFSQAWRAASSIVQRQRDEEREAEQ